MPSVSTLFGYQIMAVKGSEVDQEENGEPSVVDIWTIVLTDRMSQDQIRISFRRDVRDELVRQLTGGLVLAGGDFPTL
ncbi:MAG: hypothetical protein KatS3mg015_2538 [Fimbriimonadales bacterium]|nr:MAG: hypothetical protein KatS3mg015_2538 [Fimbriimonadales bacterium]